MTTSSNLHCHAAVRLTGLDRIRQHIGPETTRLYIEAFEARLKAVLRPVDKLIKLEEGSYCLVLREVTAHNLVVLAAAKMERLLEAPEDVVGERLFFNYHAGFAPPPDDATANTDVLRAAQGALQEAIAAGRAVLVLSGQEPTPEEPDEMLLPRIEQGLQRGEFTLYYQPKVSAAFGNVVGAEGLVRWIDTETQKVIPPGVFIELAERSGLIKPLTEHLIREAASRCSRWASSVSVAVNVPPVMLEQAGLPAVVEDALGVFHLDPARLTLEITERGRLPVVALERLNQLRALGVKVAIDDFGTGQSSLSYLRDLPADQIKVDRSFVSAMAESVKDRSIVQGCIDLAHHCGMEAVAEGVEDEATAERLKEMSCDVLQGYWFGKPVPGQTFEKEHLAGNLAAAEPDRYSALR